MFRAVSRLFMLVAAVQILGGHWAVLQSAAWIGMVVRYAQTDSLVMAAEKAFDGAHPCSLCKVVAAGRENEQRQELPKLLTKFQALVAQRVSPLPLPEVHEYVYPAVVFSFGPRGEAPLVPPPRAA